MYFHNLHILECTLQVSAFDIQIYNDGSWRCYCGEAWSHVLGR